MTARRRAARAPRRAGGIAAPWPPARKPWRDRRLPAVGCLLAVLTAPWLALEATRAELAERRALAARRQLAARRPSAARTCPCGALTCRWPTCGHPKG